MTDPKKMISEYRQRIDLDLALIRDAQAWVAERYTPVQVKSLSGEIVSESYSPEVEKMIRDLQEQELAIKKLVAESLGLTLEQVEGGA